MAVAMSAIAYFTTSFPQAESMEKLAVKFDHVMSHLTTVRFV